ncbi:MAG: class I SAM-dependent DNA methyltransferase [Deltaproteobacteria bacterium]|nr:class I SAM-dependent DNA methyltransferase [Deltaproteobacteria bacterium]
MPTALTRNEIRSRAKKFVNDWSSEERERAEKDTFWNEFFAIFGVERRKVATFERHAKRISTGRAGFIDVFWPKYLIAEHKSRGANLTAVIEQQALDYLGDIPSNEFPRLVIASDFARFRVLDLDPDTKERGEEVEFPLEDLPRQVDRFLFLAGYERRSFREQDAVNVDAAELLGLVYEELEVIGYTGHELQVLIVRLLFILFADDADLWARSQFEEYLRNRTADDGHDLGMHLSRLFDVLNTPEAQRSSAMDEDLAAFPYVNGGLFSERVRTPDCTRRIRDRILQASEFEWSGISPAIFGSMFQSVMDKGERRQLGAHYTTEKNIRRVIEPLFLDDLNADLADAGSSRQKLKNLHDRIASQTYFDPAMGCGNFLVIAYRELRRIETEILHRLHPENVQLTIQLDQWRKVSVEQFYGIEIEEFPARIAETAMYLADHLENEALGRTFGVNVVDLPLQKTAHIRIGNALTIDWSSVVAPDRCSYILGNPPFAGQTTRSGEQTADLRGVWGEQYARWLDYVTGWYKKSADYLQLAPAARVAFVSTNSITQGEQAGRVWSPIIESGIRIDFAHRTFRWSSEARGKAHVHCVIVGFSKGGRPGRKTLFEYDDIAADPVARTVNEINPYLVAGPTVLVHARSTPLSSALPQVNYGNKPSDGGFLVVDAAARTSADPIALKYLRPYVGAQELLHNEKRWCLWLLDADPGEIASSTFIQERVAKVREYREASTAADTRRYAQMPTRFFRIPQPTTDYIAIPRHVSENRHWFTVARFPATTIASDALFTAIDPDGFLFGILSSKLFILWMRTVGGMLKSDLRFSASVVYNPFPLPEIDAAARHRVIEAGKQVEVARAAFPNTCLADLYNPSATPPSVVQAHLALDRVVERLYRGRAVFAADSERLTELFERYAALTENEDPTLLADAEGDEEE